MKGPTIRFVSYAEAVETLYEKKYVKKLKRLCKKNGWDYETICEDFFNYVSTCEQETITGPTVDSPFPEFE